MMKLRPRIKEIAEKILPRFVIAWLDPVRDLIDAEVSYAAGQLGENQVVLDAGAGEGRHKKYFKSGRYVALDAGYGDPGWDYSKLDVLGRLESIPLRRESVECILCMVVLEHTRDPRQVLSEFARILKSGGSLFMVVPFLWEEHQGPHDYFRFTRYGILGMLESTHLRVDLISPMGGFFRLCARRSIGMLSFFQGGWRWIPFVFLAPFFGLIFPLILYFLDGLDREKNYTLGYRIRATKSALDGNVNR